VYHIITIIPYIKTYSIFSNDHIQFYTNQLFLINFRILYHSVIIPSNIDFQRCNILDQNNSQIFFNYIIKFILASCVQLSPNNFFSHLSVFIFLITHIILYFYKLFTADIRIHIIFKSVYFVMCIPTQFFFAWHLAIPLYTYAEHILCGDRGQFTARLFTVFTIHRMYNSPRLQLVVTIVKCINK